MSQSKQVIIMNIFLIVEAKDMLKTLEDLTLL
jgi:hypothetical protein